MTKLAMPLAHEYSFLSGITILRMEKLQISRGVLSIKYHDLQNCCNILNLCNV